MAVTARKHRLGRFLRIYSILRAVEFLFIVALVSAAQFLDENGLSFNTAADFLDSVVDMLRYSFAIALAYYIAFIYIVFSLVIFGAVEISVGLTSRNIPFVNALSYAIHGLIMLHMAHYPIIFFSIWVLIVVFNFYIPKRLEKKLFGPPES